MSLGMLVEQYADWAYFLGDLYGPMASSFVHYFWNWSRNVLTRLHRLQSAGDRRRFVSRTGQKMALGQIQKLSFNAYFNDRRIRKSGSKLKSRATKGRPK